MKLFDLKRLYTVLLLVFFAIAYILPLGARHLVVPDETRYAEIPREMVTSGDWVVPRLNGVRYFEKPVMGYWIHATSIMLLGENNFAVRLPSALAVGLSALLIYVLVFRMCRGGKEEKELAAVLASLIYLSCFEVFGVGNTALLDSLFSFFLTATIITFYFASEEPPGSVREKRFLLLSGIICGMAFLTKGFLAFAIPIVALVPYLIWQRRFLDVFRMSWLPILIAILVVLPWGVLIHLREPDFWHFFVWNEHFRRFVSDDAQHIEPFWYFFLASPPMFMPWLLMIPAAFAGIRELYRDKGEQGRLIRLSICWLVLPFLFFSFSKGKLLTYILPCFPPFAVLMSFSLIHVFKKKERNTFFQWGIVGNAIFFSIVLLALVYLELFGYKGFHLYSQSWKTMLAVSSLVFMILFYFWAFRCRSGQGKVLLFGFAPLLFFFAVHFLLPDQTNEERIPGPLLERHKQSIGDDDIIISSENTVKAVCWYLQRDDVYVLGYAGELHYGLHKKDAEGRLLGVSSAVELINRNPGKTVLFARARNIALWQKDLPQPAFQDDSGTEGYVFLRY